MSATELYFKFKELFPYFVPHVIKYRSKRKVDGIDIYLDDGMVMTFTKDPENKKSFILKRSDKVGNST